MVLNVRKARLVLHTAPNMIHGRNFIVALTTPRKQWGVNVHLRGRWG